MKKVFLLLLVFGVSVSAFVAGLNFSDVKRGIRHHEIAKGFMSSSPFIVSEAQAASNCSLRLSQIKTDCFSFCSQRYPLQATICQYGCAEMYSSTFNAMSVSGIGSSGTPGCVMQP